MQSLHACIHLLFLNLNQTALKCRASCTSSWLKSGALQRKLCFQEKIEHINCWLHASAMWTAIAADISDISAVCADNWELRSQYLLLLLRIPEHWELRSHYFCRALRASLSTFKNKFLVLNISAPVGCNFWNWELRSQHCSSEFQIMRASLSTFGCGQQVVAVDSRLLLWTADYWELCSQVYAVNRRFSTRKLRDLSLVYVSLALLAHETKLF